MNKPKSEPQRGSLQATDKLTLKIFNQQFAQTKGSPVQGELPSQCEAEGLVLTFLEKNARKSQPLRHFLAKMPPKQLFAIAGRLPPTLLHRGGSKLVPFSYFDEWFIPKTFCQQAKPSRWGEAYISRKPIIV